MGFEVSSLIGGKTGSLLFAFSSHITEGGFDWYGQAPANESLTYATEINEY
jgi:hypothetical protein